MRNRALMVAMITLFAFSSWSCIQHEGQVALFLTGTTNNTALIAGDVRQVNLVVSSVEVQEPKSGSFLTLSRGSQSYELVGLGGTGNRTLLAVADQLSEGNYTEVRLTFDASSSYLVDTRGRQKPLVVDPVVLSVPTLFTVVADQSVDVLLSFDLSASLAQKANGTWVLRPVIRQVTSGR